MAKLTAPQRRFLERVERDTFSDNSGSGLILHDGYEERMGFRLHEMGLVHMPQICTSFNGPRITPAGRAALAEAKKPKEEK